MNMKVTDTNLLGISGPNPGTPGVRPAQTPSVEKPNDRTEVSLAPESQSVFGSRADRVAQLKSVVESGAYKPNSQSVSEKLVSGALSRPE